MKKLTMLFLTLAVALANMPIMAMRGRGSRGDSTSTRGSASRGGRGGSVARGGSMATRGGFNQAHGEPAAQIAPELSSADTETPEVNQVTTIQVCKALGKGVTVIAAVGLARAAAFAYIYPQAACEQIANYCANSGAMVCNQAMTTCAPYLVKPELTFWQQILGYLGF